MEKYCTHSRKSGTTGRIAGRYIDAPEIAERQQKTNNNKKAEAYYCPSEKKEKAL